MKHHYAIESCTQETLYYYYAVDMKVNAPDHKPQANSLTVKPLVLKSVIHKIHLLQLCFQSNESMYARSGKIMQF